MTERTRELCWSEFRRVVGALRAGVKDDAAVYLRAIRARFGQKTYEQAKKELVAFARSGLEPQ
jgi:hypothetical protein